MAVFREKSEEKSDHKISEVHCIIGVELIYNFIMAVTSAMEQ